MRAPLFYRAATWASILLSFCLWQASTSNAQDIALLKLSFMPFGIETPVAMTPENIGEHGQGRTFLFQGRHAFVRKLRGMLSAHEAKGQIQLKSIRLKADFGPSTGIILVDHAGVVLHTGRNVTFKLTAAEMRSIERDISAFIGVVDLTAYEKEPGLKPSK